MAPVATAVGKIQLDDLATITSSDGWSLAFMIDSSFLIKVVCVCLRFMHTQRSFRAQGESEVNLTISVNKMGIRRSGRLPIFLQVVNLAVRKWIDVYEKI